jgi:putative zinc finger/helix-turn-helix YgiT family protein
MTNPRDYPDVIESAESGRPLRRGVKILTITVNGKPFAYGQPGWWASLDDPEDNEGQLADEDNMVRAAARREARARAKHTSLSPLEIKAIRELCALSQKEASRVFGGGPKAFEKYESGEVAPSSAMVRLLLLAARRPELFRSKADTSGITSKDAKIIWKTVQKSSIAPIYQQIYSSQPERLQKVQFRYVTEGRRVSKHQLFVERRPQGDYAVRRANSERASAGLPTQAQAIARAKEINPGHRPLGERVVAVLTRAKLAKSEGGKPMKEQVAEIVAAYVGHNTIPSDQLPTLITSVRQALAGLGQSTAAPPAALTPAVPIRRSVGANAITCLDCGYMGQMLKRHLTTAHGLGVDEYRTRWGLPSDYPMVAPNYAARRSELAKQIGLGTRGGRRAKG